MWKAKISIGTNEEYSISSFCTQGAIFLCRYVGKMMLTSRPTLKIKAQTFPFGNKRWSLKSFLSKSVLSLDINERLTHCFTHGVAWHTGQGNRKPWTYQNSFLMFCHWISKIGNKCSVKRRLIIWGHFWYLLPCLVEATCRGGKNMVLGSKKIWLWYCSATYCPCDRLHLSLNKDNHSYVLRSWGWNEVVQTKWGALWS